MSFSFNFSGDDIDESLDQSDDVQTNGGDPPQAGHEAPAAEAAKVEIKQHDLKDLVG